MIDPCGETCYNSWGTILDLKSPQENRPLPWAFPLLCLVFDTIGAAMWIVTPLGQLVNRNAINSVALWSVTRRLWQQLPVLSLFAATQWWCKVNLKQELLPTIWAFLIILTMIKWEYTGNETGANDYSWNKARDIYQHDFVSLGIGPESWKSPDFICLNVVPIMCRDMEFGDVVLLNVR